MKLRQFLIITALYVPILLSLANQAAAQVEYKTLTTLPGIGEKYVADSGNFSDFLNTAFTLGISIAIGLAIIMLVIAGIQYMASDAFDTKSEAKNKIWNATGGLILALSIYIFLNTINPDLVSLKLTMDKAEVGLKAPATRAPAPSTPGGLPEAFSNEDEIRTSLREAGIEINKSACRYEGQSNCTNVGGLSQRGVDNLIAFKRACDSYAQSTSRLNVRCYIKVTGGTEYWLHTGGTTHRPGNPVVDLAPDPWLNKFVTGDSSNPKSLAQGGRGYQKNGASFSFENTGDNSASTGAHWHVRF